MGIVLALLPLRLVGIKPLKKCTISPPVEPTVMHGPHGLEIRSQEMGAPVWSPPFQPVAAGGLWVPYLLVKTYIHTFRFHVYVRFITQISSVCTFYNGYIRFHQ